MKKKSTMLHFSTFILLSLLQIIHASAEVVPNIEKQHHLYPRIDFYPQELKAIVENELKHVSFGITWENASEFELQDSIHNFEGDFLVSVTSKNPPILEIVNSSYPYCIQSKDAPKNFSFVVKGIFLGYTEVTVTLTPAPRGCVSPENFKRLPEAPNLNTRAFSLSVSVIRPPSVLVDVVTGVMAALVAFNYINMGVQLDLHCIGKVLKKPIGPVIGFVCQFLFMPVVSKSYFVNLSIFLKFRFQVKIVIKNRDSFKKYQYFKKSLNHIFNQFVHLFNHLSIHKVILCKLMIEQSKKKIRLH